MMDNDRHGLLVACGHTAAALVGAVVPIRVRCNDHRRNLVSTQSWVTIKHPQEEGGCQCLVQTALQLIHLLATG